MSDDSTIKTSTKGDGTAPQEPEQPKQERSVDESSHVAIDAVDRAARDSASDQNPRIQEASANSYAVPRRLVVQSASDQAATYGRLHVILYTYINIRSQTSLLPLCDSNLLVTWQTGSRLSARQV